MLKRLLEHNTFKYLAVAVLLVVPLYPKFPFISVPGTFVSIRVEDFLLLVASIFLSIRISKDRFSIFTKDMPRYVSLFVLVGLLSLVTALYITRTVTVHLAFLHWVRRIEYFIPFFLGLYATKGEKDTSFYLKVLMLVVIIVTIYGLGQRYLNWPIIATQNEEYSKGVALRYRPGGHISSTFAGHYDLSSFLVLIIPVFLAYLFSAFDKLSLRSKTLLLLVIISGIWLIAVSGSRISSVSFLIAGSVGLLLVKRVKAIPIFVVVSLVVFMVSPSLKARYIRLFEVTKEKVESVIGSSEFNVVLAANESSGLPQKRIVTPPTPTPIPVFEDRSTSIRLNVEWPRAVRAFSKDPVLGTGYSSINLATDNDYLRLLGEVGLMGLAAFALIIFEIMNLLLQALPFGRYKGVENYLLAGLSGGIVGILINATFIDLFEASKFAIIFWLMIGILVSTIYKYKYEQ